MIYNETMSGGAKAFGCSDVYVSHIYVTQFGVGDIAYYIKKAKKGILEKIVVKEIIPVRASLVGGIFLVLYKDTLNALWNEDDLIPLSEAKQYAIDYLEAQLLALQEQERKKCQ